MKPVFKKENFKWSWKAFFMSFVFWKYKQIWVNGKLIAVVKK